MKYLQQMGIIPVSCPVLTGYDTGMIPNKYRTDRHVKKGEQKKRMQAHPFVIQGVDLVYFRRIILLLYERVGVVIRTI